MDTIIFQTVVRGRVARNFNARSGTERHGNEFIQNGNLRIPLIATGDGVRKSDAGKETAFGHHVLRINGRERKRSLKALHIALHAFSLVSRMQPDGLLCHGI